MQRLLSTYRWDADLVRDDLAGYVVEHLGDADGVLVVDETGFLKKGNKSAGCSVSTAARRAGLRTVRLGYSWPMPRPRENLAGPGTVTCPRSGAEDRERRREAGVPEDVGFQTKPRLAQRMLERALESGVPFGWVAGDEVLRQRPQPAAVAGTGRYCARSGHQEQREAVGLDGQGTLQMRADRLASQVDESDWRRV